METLVVTIKLLIDFYTISNPETATSELDDFTPETDVLDAACVDALQKFATTYGLTLDKFQRLAILSAAGRPDCGDEVAFEEWGLDQYLDLVLVEKLLGDFEEDPDWMNEAIEEIDEPSVYYSTTNPVCSELIRYDNDPFDTDRQRACLKNLNMAVPINGTDHFFSFKFTLFDCNRIDAVCNNSLEQITANALNIGLVNGIQRSADGNLVGGQNLAGNTPVPISTANLTRYTIWIEIQKAFTVQVLECAGHNSGHIHESSLPSLSTVLRLTEYEDLHVVYFEEEFSQACQ